MIRDQYHMKSCNQCGKCCIKYSNAGLSATEDEIKLWDSFRPDIYEYVSNGKIWMNPTTGEQLTICPWLNKQSENIYTCKIYYDRPEDCKFYPVTIEQMIQDECEMLEPRDLTKTSDAQTKLDKLMFDSRPPFKD